MNTTKILLPLLILTAACTHNGDSGGGGGAGGGGVSARGEGALTGQTAIFEASRGASSSGRSTALADSTSAAISARVAAAAPATPTARAKANQKKAKLAQTFQGNCKVTTKMANTPAPHASQMPSDHAPVSNPTASQFGQALGNMDITIAGANCPVHVNMQMHTLDGAGHAAQDPCATTAHGESCEFSIDAHMEYQVVDAQVAQELEVKSGEFSLKIKMKTTMPTEGASSNMAIVLDEVFDLQAIDPQNQTYSATGHSLAQLAMNIPTPDGTTMESPQGSGAVTEDLHYEEPGAKLDLNSTQNSATNESSFKVNGVPVDAQTYETAKEKFMSALVDLSGGSQGNQPSGPGAQTPPTCEGAECPPATGVPIHSQPPATHPPIVEPPAPQPPATQPVIPEPPVTQPPVSSQPTPSDRAVACIVESYAPTRDLYIGYGPADVVARSMAKQACGNAAGDQCSATVTCERQSVDPKAFFCESKNYQSSHIFNAYGASVVEAKYNTKRSCIETSTEPSQCAEVTDCQPVQH